MRDAIGNLAIAKSQMQAVLDAFESGKAHGRGEKNMRHALLKLADADAPGGRFAGDPGEELYVAIRRAVQTRHDAGDDAKAEVDLKELRELRAELERRLFPYGIDYKEPAMCAVKSIRDTRPPALLRCAGELDSAILTIGEVCVLSGEGGVGKSTLALEWAYAMAAGAEIACGMVFPRNRPEVAGAPAVVYASAEDAAWAIKERADRLAERYGHHEISPSLHHIDMRGRTLFAPPRDGGFNAPAETTADWDYLWEKAGGLNASMVVIDPVMALYAGNENRAVEVRAFISALVERASRQNCGVLLLAHSTKAARGKDADRYSPGNVSGSASWTDGVRGALAIDWRPQEEDADGGDGIDGWRVLKVLKANYGMPRIECELSPQHVMRSEKRGALVGFDAVGGWHFKRKPQGKRNGGRVRGKAGIDDDLKPAV